MWYIKTLVFSNVRQPEQPEQILSSPTVQATPSSRNDKEDRVKPGQKTTGLFHNVVSNYLSHRTLANPAGQNYRNKGFLR
jgi:hypothetical protein